MIGVRGMKKVTQLLVAFLAIVGIGISTSLGRNQEVKANADGNIGFKSLFSYSDEELTVGEDYVSAINSVDGNKKGLLFTSKNTGEKAVGTKIDYNGILSGNFEMDFRVFSQKTYAPKDAALTYTHTMPWDGNLIQNTALYEADAFNPYCDLREVGVTFTSTINPDAWFTVYFRGGYADLRADLVSARVLASTDNQNWQGVLKGYGLVGNQGFPNADWTDPINGCAYTMVGSSFSNTTINNFPESSVMFKFDPVSMQVLTYCAGYGLCRNLATNDGLRNYQNDFGTLNSNDFINGYTISIEFTDVTNNLTIGGQLEDGTGAYNNVNAQYQQFSQAYDRYANMVVYSLNGMGLSSDTQSTTPYIKAHNNINIETNMSVDVTPEIYDIKQGKVNYTGKVEWSRLGDGKKGVVNAANGQYSVSFPETGSYIITYGSQTLSGGATTPSVSVLINVHKYGAWHEGVAATCDSAGKLGYYQCEDCAKYFDRQGNVLSSIEQPKSGHDYVWIKATLSTCTTEGTVGHYHCRGCGGNYDSDYNELHDLSLKIAHKIGEWISEVPSTCYSSGVRGHYHCSECNVDLDENGEVLSNLSIAAAHKYGKYIEEQSATCAQDGTKAHYHCDGCGKDFDAQHNEIADVTIKATGDHADNDNDGVCDNCGENLSKSGCSSSINKSGAIWIVVAIIVALSGNLLKKRKVK